MNKFNIKLYIYISFLLTLLIMIFTSYYTINISNDFIKQNTNDNILRYIEITKNNIRNDYLSTCDITIIEKNFRTKLDYQYAFLTDNNTILTTQINENILNKYLKYTSHMWMDFYEENNNLYILALCKGKQNLTFIDDDLYSIFIKVRVDFTVISNISNVKFYTPSTCNGSIELFSENNVKEGCLFFNVDRKLTYDQIKYIILVIMIFITIYIIITFFIIKSANYINNLNQNLLIEKDKLNKEKTLILTNMAHELKTPMGIIFGFIELIKYNLITPQKHNEYVEIIHKNCVNLIEMINQMLEYSSITEIEVKIQKLNIKDELDELLLSMKNFFDKKKQTIFVDYPDNLIFYSDKMKLRSILLNLLSNANKYGDELSLIKISISINDEFNMTITNDCEEIPTHIKNALFKPFQLNNLTKENSNGLGLSIVKKILTRLNGNIIINSPVDNNRGVSVNVTIPNMRNMNE